VRKLFQALKSVRLGVGLIAYLAVTGMLATLVPQGREAGFYFTSYPRLVAETVVRSGFSRFFTSLQFLLPSALFFVNLAVCSVDRFLREIRRPEKRRHGPDVLHLGLLLLVVGAVLSFSGRQTGSVMLAEGDRVAMSSGRFLVLEDFACFVYPDGRPRDWVSTVRVERGGREEIRSFPIRVNHPLRLGRMSIYQVSHAVEIMLAVADPSGEECLLGQGGEAVHGGVTLFFMAREQGTDRAVVRLTRGAEAEVLRLGPGERAGGFLIAGLREVDITGLEAVVDPGYPLVVAAFALITVGVFFTFALKIGDMK